MRRLIPGKTKVQIELFKGVLLSDIAVAAVFGIMMLFVVISSLPYKGYICLALLFIAALLLARLDTQPNYVYILNILRHCCYKRRYARWYTDEMLKERVEGSVVDHAVDVLFGSGKANASLLSKGESKREKKARMKAEEKARKVEEKVRKAEDKVLNDPDAPQEEKDAILERRKAQEVSRKGETAPPTEKKSKKELKAEEKEKKARRKEEDRILKGKETTQEEKDAILERRAKESKEAMKKMAAYKEENTQRNNIEEIIPFTGIQNDLIEYGGKYYGAVLEIDPMEFRFFSPHRRRNSIESGLGRVLRSLNAEFSANIVKIERPIRYDRYLKKEYSKLDELRAAYENGLITELELKARVEVLYDRINQLRNLCYEDQVIEPFYYLVLFDSDKRQLENQVLSALNTLGAGEMKAKRLNTKELAVFLKYSNQLDFDEREVDKIAPEDYAQWAMPNTVDIRQRTVEINHIVTHNMRIVGYPSVVNDAWLASVMSMPATKCVVKCKPMDRNKAIRGIDRSLQELRGQVRATGVDSKAMELQEHIATLSELLATLQQDNESLLEVNVYVTAYDIAATRNNLKIVQPPVSQLSNIANMKKTVRRLYQEHNLRLNNMEFDQLKGFIGAQISAWDPMGKKGRGIPSNSLAASFPWIFAHVSDEGGINLGSSQGVPVFIDFFRRDSERVNSNMVVIGKSGSGKSYATKSLLTNLAAEDSKIFILDPENEYTALAENLHGKFINVGNAQYGRLNPFHIITALEDDESDGSSISGSYATHLQFLEEFFRQILPDCDKDALEYLNSLVDRMYTNHGITAETDLRKLRPEDYPIFDDLYDAILAEFQQTDNMYIHTILRTLMNYVAKFAAGGRNANIWNGPSTVTTDENFIVFNFQSLLANRNSTIANAQMLLVLKYVDNEIIKNRDYNTKYNLKRKIVVVIDEAHVFIDNKFPVALDFMFQLAKRIRKYNGMQIVITQNIKDFVGSEEIARKSTAIINACQYSFIFSLAPNDIHDLCKLYEKAGGINEIEQEQITTAPRGQAFTIMSPSSRSTFKVEVPADVTAMFRQPGFVSNYFSGQKGAEVWENFVGESRAKRAAKLEELQRQEGVREEKAAAAPQSRVIFEELEFEPEPAEMPVKKTVTFLEEVDEKPQERNETTVLFEEFDEDDFSGISFEEISEPETPEVPVVSAVVKVQTEQPAESPVVQQPSRTEEMLFELMGKFSYESMLSEIRRTVRAEMEREAETRVAQVAAVPAMPSVPITPAEPVVPITPAEPAAPETPAVPNAPVEDAVPEEMPVVDTPTEENPFSGFPMLEGIDIEEADEMAIRVAEEMRAEEQQAEEALAEETEPVFDIMQLLAAEAEKLANVSPIDMMDTYGELVIEITLEELVHYNNAQRSKRRMR